MKRLITIGLILCIVLFALLSSTLADGKLLTLKDPIEICQFSYDFDDFPQDYFFYEFLPAENRYYDRIVERFSHGATDPFAPDIFVVNSVMLEDCETYHIDKNYLFAVTGFPGCIVCLNTEKFYASNKERQDAITLAINSFARPLVQSISFEGGNSIHIATGETYTCKTVIKPEDAVSKYEWTSSDPAIASVKDGKIKGIKPGACDITCKALDGSEATAECHVEVHKPVTSIAVDEKAITLLIGTDEDKAFKQLSFTVMPEDTFWKSVIWSSSNEDIATVDENGTVRGISAGKATITASSAQPNSKVKAQIKMTVNQAVERILTDTDKITIQIKKKETVKASVEPTTASNKKLEWISEDESIATVNNQGQITGISTGETTIIARSMDESGTEAKVLVSVVSPEK